MLKKTIHNKARCNLEHEVVEAEVAHTLTVAAKEHLVHVIAATIMGEVSSSINSKRWRQSMIGVGMVFLNRFGAPIGRHSGTITRAETGFQSLYPGNLGYKALQNTTFSGPNGVAYARALSVARGIVSGEISGLSGAENANFEMQGHFYPGTIPEKVTQPGTGTATYLSCGHL